MSTHTKDFDSDEAPRNMLPESFWRPVRTDFSIVRDAILHVSSPLERDLALKQLDDIEANLSALEAMLDDPAKRKQPESAVAMAKGCGK